MSDFFDLIDEKKESAYEPLSSKLRPKTLDEVLGQNHLLKDTGVIGSSLKNKKIPSLIFWGPAGVGKTTISLLLAEAIGADFRQISAVFAGVADMKKIFEEAKYLRQNGKPFILFVDEIHRFNKAQQDCLLPVVERGDVILIGATTENPSFELNSALLSRCRVCVLNSLKKEDLYNIIERAEKFVGKKLLIDEEAKEALVSMVDGDCRYLINMLETLFDCAEKTLNTQEMMDLITQRASISDKTGDTHYNLISALHKSLRGSDENAALYWGFRMVEAGQDMSYIFRRILRFASEDVGNADPQAVPLVLSCWQSYDRIGSPEGDIFLAQSLVYLALAPKSNATYVAQNVVKEFVRKYGSLMPPKNILNAPTTLMKNLDYGKGYNYDHDVEGGFSGDNYFPDEIKNRPVFYNPVERGFERELKKRKDYFDNIRKSKKK